MQEITDPSTRRNIGDCFYLQIPLSGCEEEIRYFLRNAMRLEKGVGAMLDGSMDVEELLEFVEDCVPCMDEYLEEVEDSLEILLR